MSGWYTIDRDALAHPVLKHAARWVVFTRLLGMANYQPGTVIRRGHTIPLERGQVALALRPWAEDIGLSYKEVRGAIEVLTREGILKHSVWINAKMGATGGKVEGAICTIITICNYDKYQPGTRVEGAEEGQNTGANGAQLGRNSGAQQKKKNKERRGEDASPAGAAPARPRGSRLGTDWKPDATCCEYARSKGFSTDQIAHEAERFVNYWTAKPGQAGTKLDWTATWRNWVMDGPKRPPGREPPKLRLVKAMTHLDDPFALPKVQAR